MFTKCANSECAAAFDYRQGQLIRISTTLPGNSNSGDHVHVEHFWLCRNCSKFYYLSYERGANQKIGLQPRESSVTNSCEILSTHDR